MYKQALLVQCTKKESINIININEITKILVYFIIYSFFGWVLESIFKTIIDRKAVNSGFLHGPICPIYGIGAIIMFTFLRGLKDNYILLFLTGFVVLSIWEYIVGWFLEKTFKTKYWDYSGNKFNINGRVCLMNSIFWGGLGMVFTIFIHPEIEKLVTTLPVNVWIYILIPIYLIMMIDFIITDIKLNKINQRLKMLTEITENIKDKIEEIKKIKNAKSIEAINNIIDEFKEKQNEMKDKLEKQTRRLRNAFPTMKSEKITEFLSEKLERFKRK